MLILAQLTGAAAQTGFQPPKSGAVSGAEGMELLGMLGSDLVILDVRTQAEFDQGHIPGAMLLPVEELGERRAEVPRDRPVLIVCRTGRRAAYAYDMLQASGPHWGQLWYLRATPQYNTDGSFTFQ